MPIVSILSGYIPPYSNGKEFETPTGDHPEKPANRNALPKTSVDITAKQQLEEQSPNVSP